MRSLLVVLLGIATAVAATLLALPGPSAGAVASKPDAGDAALPPIPEAPAPAADLTLAGPATPGQIQRGARVYRTLCVACHLPDGRGMATVTPPLAGASHLSANREHALRTVLKGLAGTGSGNGVDYQGVMPALEQVLTDAQVADVLTYVYNSWGNAGAAFAADHVARRRDQWRNQPRVMSAAPTPP